MNIETTAITTFLYTVNPNIFSELCIEYEFKGFIGWSGCNLNVNLTYSPEEISKEIRRKFEEMIPSTQVSEITFHNGSRDNVRDYNGQNEGVLRNKLILHDYLKIISLLQSQPPNRIFQPRIIDGNC